MSYPSKFYKNLIKSIACGLILAAASGQAFAVTYTSQSNIIGTADLINGAKWATGGPCVGTAGSGAISMGSGDILAICIYSLTLTASDTVTAGTLLFDGGTSPNGTWGGGVLKFSSGSKAIINGNSALSSIALNVSSMTSGDTITINSGGGTNSVTFSSVTGGSLDCAASYPATVAPGTTCTVTVTPPANAPIDLNFSKTPETFATEIELK